MSHKWTVALIVLGGFVMPAEAAERALTDAQWHADLAQMSQAVRDIHFKPFHQVTESDFDAAVNALANAIPEKSDHEIIVEMAKIVALLGDGHTRLHIPRRHPQFALEAELGHSGTPPPKIEGLAFDQLPVAFFLANASFPGNADTQAGLGRTQELMGSPEAATQHYRDALSIDPRNALARKGLERLGTPDQYR